MTQWPMIPATLVTIAMSAQAAQAQPLGDVFTSRESGFSIAFPEKPRESSRRVKGEAVKEFVVRSKSRDLLWVAVSAKAIDTGEYFNAARNLLPSGMTGKVVVFRQVQNSKDPGVEVVMDRPDGSKCRYHVFRADPKTYIVVLCGKGGATSGEKADRYFRSFLMAPGK